MILDNKFTENELFAAWSVEEFIDKAEAIIAKNPTVFGGQTTAGLKRRGTKQRELNVRLMRDYVVRGFIPRPARVGREARFGFTHLVQVLAVRALLRNQRWSLSAIKSSLTDVTAEEILASVLSPIRDQLEAERAKFAPSSHLSASVIPSAPPVLARNPAQLLIEKFRQTSRGSPAYSAALVGPPAQIASAEPLSRHPTTSRSTRVHLDLAPGCEFQIEAERLRSLTSEDIHRLSETLLRRLHEETAR
jgi:hypothetical protein